MHIGSTCPLMWDSVLKVEGRSITSEAKYVITMNCLHLGGKVCFAYGGASDKSHLNETGVQSSSRGELGGCGYQDEQVQGLCFSDLYSFNNFAEV